MQKKTGPKKSKTKLSRIVKPSGAAGRKRSTPKASAASPLTKSTPPVFDSLSRLLQENRKLKRTILTYQYQLNMLRQTAVKITSELSLDQTLNTLVLTASDFFEADALSCMLWDEMKEKFIIAAGVGFQTEYIKRQVIPAERVRIYSQDGRAYHYFENIQAAPQGDIKLLQEENLVSVLTVLMRFGNEVLGAINIYSRGKVRRFSEEEIENGRLFAQQAAIAVRNAYLYKAMQEEAQISKTLRQMAEDIGSLNSLDAVMNRIVLLIMEAIKIKICAIFLWDDRKNLFIPAKAVGVPPHRSPLFQTLILRSQDINFSPEELAQRVVLSAEKSPGRFPMEKFTSVMQERDLRLVPLVTKGKLLGLIIVAGYHSPHPFNYRDEMFLQGIAAEAAIGVDDANLFTALENAFWDIIRSLAAAIEVKDSYTHSHSESVGTYALALGEELGLNPKELDLLSKSCLVHDLGKIGIEDNILQKETPLTFIERKNIERHPVIGSRILHSVSSLTDVAIIVHHHHEHYNGKGYPEGLAGERIPLLARILAIADSFDAMTSDRPYRKALTLEQAMSELQKCSGTQFDPKLIQLFLRVLDRKKNKWGFVPPKSSEPEKSAN